MGFPVRVYDFLLMFFMGVVVAGAVQLAGALLITSLLIIPASTARLFAKSPEAMGVGGSLFACLSMLIGLPLAQQMAVPIGPAIVSFSVAVFLVVLSAKLLMDWAKSKKA